MADSHTGSPSTNLSTLLANATRLLTETLGGDHHGRLASADGSAEQTAFQAALNALLEQLETQTEDQHLTSMELAMGLSECFSVLAEVRAGNLDAAVGEGTIGSSVDVVAKLGTTLNETISEIRMQIDTIERQRLAIRELSTPILQLWDSVLAMPIIGLVDTRRSADIMERMLTEIVSQQSQFVILDITGVEVVDTRTADYFIKMIRAAELLGAQCFLTGIQPAVAQTLVEIGVDLSALRTLRNLQAGLKECLELMGRRRGQASHRFDAPLGAALPENR